MIFTLLNKSGITSKSWGGDGFVTKRRQGEGLVQTTVNGTATVEIQGRMTSTDEWHTIDTTTQSNSTVATRVAIFPQMRAIVRGVTDTATATGGVATTTATGTVTVDAIPTTALSNSCFAVLPADAVKTRITLTAQSDASGDGDSIVVKDGMGATLNAEMDSSSVHYSHTATFTGTDIEGGIISIFDVGGKSRAFYLTKTTDSLADTSLRGQAVEVDCGSSPSVTNIATALTTAINTEFTNNRLSVYATSSSGVVTLQCAELASATDAVPSNSWAKYLTLARKNDTVPVTLTAWAGGSVVGTTSVSPSTDYPLAHAASNATQLAQNIYMGLQNAVNTGLIQGTVTIASAAVDFECIEAGAHHVYNATVPDALSQCTATETGDTVVITFASGTTVAGTNGTNPLLIQLTEASTAVLTGYTRIERAALDTSIELIDKVAASVAATAYTAGSNATITAVTAYDNETLNFSSAGTGLVGYGNGVIALTADPHSILGKTDMTGGAAGVTVTCNLDVPEST